MPGKKTSTKEKSAGKKAQVTVGDIKARSHRRPQKVVVDEILPDKHIRVCVSQMRPGRRARDFLELAAWRKDETAVLTLSDLGGLVTKKQHNELREGRVFLIVKGRSKDVYNDVRKHVKERAGRVIEREGRSKRELGRRPAKRRG